jgi:hypothetical protein
MSTAIDYTAHQRFVDRRRPTATPLVLTFRTDVLRATGRSSALGPQAYVRCIVTRREEDPAVA